jgi:hypothetical protein
MRGLSALVQHPALAVALHLLGQVARVFHAARARREDQLGAERLHGLRAFDAQVFGHDQQHAVTADRCRHRQRDAGVARGGFDQGVAGLDVSALLGAADHADGRPVLHRPGGVVAFELAEEDVAALVVALSRHAHQTHHRRIADHVFDGGIFRVC